MEAPPGCQSVAAQEETNPMTTTEYSVLDADASQNTSDATSKADAFTQHKFDWIGRVAFDGTLPSISYRVAIVVLQHINRKHRNAILCQSELAAKLRVSLRTLSTAVSALRKRGHLSVKQRGDGKSAIYTPDLDNESGLQDYPLESGIRHAEACVAETVSTAETCAPEVSGAQVSTFSCAGSRSQLRKNLRREPIDEPIDEPFRASHGADTPRSVPAEPVYTDDKHRLFGEGVPILIQLGLAEGRARQMIGKWLKDTRDDAHAVLGAIQRARDHRAVDPIPWITQALPTSTKNKNGNGNGNGTLFDAAREFSAAVAARRAGIDRGEAVEAAAE